MSKLAEDIRNSVQRSKGKESIIFFDQSVVECDLISTQNISIDQILGGGMPLGRSVEIFGEEGSGKTTLALHLLSEAQRQKGIALMVDVEHSLNLEYAKEIGINLKDFLFSQPSSGEEAFEIIYEVIKEKMKVDQSNPLVIVLDSVAALLPKEEVIAEIGDYKISPVAKLMSQSLRRISGIVKRSNTLLIFLNQMRTKINTFYGGITTSYSTGGKALKFYASIRVSLKTGKILKIGGDQVGQMIKVETKKNKLYPPFQETEIRLIWGKGIDPMFSLVMEAINQKIIKKKGSWFLYEDIKVQGFEMLIKEIGQDKMEKIRKEIKCN